MGQSCSLAEVAGEPAIAYLGDAPGDLRYLRRDGEAFAAPVVIQEDDAEEKRQVSLAVLDGRPAVAYADAAQVKLQLGATEDGARWTWSPQVLGPMLNTWYENDVCLLALGAGRFGVAHYQSNTGDLHWYV